MIIARVRNWYKRNLRNATDIPVWITCAGQGDKSPGGAYFQVRIKDQRDGVEWKGWLTVTLTPQEAVFFAAEVAHCTKRFTEEPKL